MKENYSWSDMANFMTDCGIPHELSKQNFILELQYEFSETF